MSAYFLLLFFFWRLFRLYVLARLQGESRHYSITIRDSQTPSVTEIFLTLGNKRLIYKFYRLSCPSHTNIVSDTTPPQKLYFLLDFFDETRLSTFLLAASNSSSFGSVSALLPYLEASEENIVSNFSFLESLRCDIRAWRSVSAPFLALQVWIFETCYNKVIGKGRKDMEKLTCVSSFGD